MPAAAAMSARIRQIIAGAALIFFSASALSVREFSISAATSGRTSSGLRSPITLPHRAARQASRSSSARSCSSFAAFISLRRLRRLLSASLRTLLRLSVTAVSSREHSPFARSSSADRLSRSRAASSSPDRRRFVSDIRASSSGSLPRLL